VCSELALIDVAVDKLRAEKMDLADGLAFMKHRIIISADTGSSIYTCTVRCRCSRRRKTTVCRWNV